MKSTHLLSMAALLAGTALTCSAFCGFYVAKADTSLFNKASKVVIVRDGDRTVLTMANDFQGDAKDFAVVIPVPTFLEREQIHVTEMKYVDHLDAYTAPRLVEYFDKDPCYVPRPSMRMAGSAAEGVDSAVALEPKAKKLGVTIEATYAVGEYDILILSAKESAGLATWLKNNGYKIPEGADAVLGSYLKQGMRFFVAKVNVARQAKEGFSYLRPLQVAYESPKFMLPIRLGTLNANGPQDLFAFMLSRKGRVEPVNYRTVRLPTGMDLPLFVKKEFDTFYPAMFSTLVEKEDHKAVVLEYAWDMAWCDPCAADPLNREELQELGVFWLDEGNSQKPGISRRRGPVAQNVFVTRLHVRYTAETFPEDLRFQETGDRTNFQGRYVMRHAWKGDPTKCKQAREYFENLQIRRAKEATTLASLTGWDVNDIRQKMQLSGNDKPKDVTSAPPKGGSPWWKKLWD